MSFLDTFLSELYECSFKGLLIKFPQQRTTYQILSVKLPLPPEGEFVVEFSVGVLIARCIPRHNVRVVGACFFQVELPMNRVHGDRVDSTGEKKAGNIFLISFAGLSPTD